MKYRHLIFDFDGVLVEYNEIISGDRVQVLSRQYTKLVKQKVIDAESVQGSLEFLSK